ncbi:chemotaxis-specific protein-glutamate methyltransferase CheB [Sphingopyxis sp. R3-92]|uniref:chemotaxis-specific protein-glutamate methyltransferase CheB n=1 Tax=Sphingopyxis sp. R3-92 TaxID=3158553 RepID=UPI003EE71F96
MIKLLLVDDSPLMRRLLAEIFAQAGDFEVEVARSAEEALAALETFRPNVITLDIHMPGMDGLACLDRIMVLRPTPVVMVSALTADGADETLEALALGAVDFIPKPRGALSLEIEHLAGPLVDKVRQAASARLSRTARLRERLRARAEAAGAFTPAAPPPRRARSRAGDPAPLPEGAHVVLVGCSTGGPPALDELLGSLPSGFPWPIVIAQHMPASFTGPLARRLDRLCALDVVEVDQSLLLEPGRAYIGRGDADLIVSRRGGANSVMPAPSDPAVFWHPSVDRLVNSALKHFPADRLVGVLMTGMGADGASAMGELHARGGHTIAEDETTSVVWGMPGALVAAGGASSVRPLGEIGGELVALAGL